VVLATGPVNRPAQALGGYRLETPLVVRVAGLPASALRDLRLKETWELLGTITDLDRELADAADELGQALFDAIADLSESPVKPRVVAVRRAIHQGRVPRKGEWDERTAAALPADVVVAVERWLALLRDRDRCRADLPRSLADEVERKQEPLRRACADPLFQHALLRASPALYEEIRKWLADDGRRLRRRTLVGVARYLSRAAAKTSPYSTFTTSAVGGWRVNGPAVGFTGNLQVRGVLELDRGVLGRLMRELTGRPALAATLPVRLNPSTLVGDDTLSFIGPRPDESIMTLPMSPSLAECLRVARNEGENRTVAELCTLLAAQTGADPALLRPFLDRLVEIGLLERRPPVRDQSERPLDELLAWLRSAGADSVVGPEVTSLIERLRSDVDQPFAMDATPTAQKAPGERVSALATSLGLPAAAIERLRRTVSHESSMFPHARVECALPRWRPALDDLDLVRRWLALHDWLLPTRLAIASYVGNRFGQGAWVPFLTLHQAIQQDLLRPDEECDAWLAALRPLLRLSTPAWPSFLARSEVPRLRELHRLRVRSYGFILSGEQESGVVRVDQDALARLVDSWPSWVRTPGSIACYVQPYLTGEDLRLAVNLVGSGYGRGRSRWLRLAAQAGADQPRTEQPGTEQPSPEPSRAQGTDPVVAEVSGVFDASVNLRTPLAPYEIDYPFTASDRPAGERIPLSDLTVVHDADTDLLRLRSRRLGVDVLPAHLGMLGDTLMPPAARLLLSAFGPSHLVHSAIATVYPLGEDAEGGPLRRLPRVEVGRVTLQRARWFVPVAEVPARAAGEDDAGYLLRMVGWLRAHGIPDRCYVRVMDPEGEWREQFFSKARKPMFVDFANFFLGAAFEHMLKDRGGLVTFEEALPPPEGGCGLDPADPRVTEFVIELSASEVVR
jgi:Lantibiotic dehydratase, N terminus